MSLKGKRIVIAGADFYDVRLDTEIYDLQSISILTQPSKTEYGLGETFSPNGITINAVFVGRDNQTTINRTITNMSTGFDYSPKTAFNTKGITEITISYTKNGITKTTSVFVTVGEIQWLTNTDWQTAELDLFISTFDGLTTTFGTHNPLNQPFVIYNTTNTGESVFAGKHIGYITLPFRCRTSEMWNSEGMDCTFYVIPISSRTADPASRRASAIAHKTFTISTASWNSAELKTLNLDLAVPVGHTIAIGGEGDSISPLINQGKTSTSPFNTFTDKTGYRIWYGAEQGSSGTTNYVQPIIWNYKNL